MKKHYLALCMLAYFIMGCNLNEIPVPPKPPAKPDWLLVKAEHPSRMGLGALDTIHYNSFYKPVLSKFTGYLFGKPQGTDIDTFIYDSQHRLVKSQRLAGILQNMVVLLEYDGQGRVVKVTRSGNEDINGEAYFTYRDTIVEGLFIQKRFDEDTTRSRFVYDNKGNLLKRVAVARDGSITVIQEYLNYDNSPNPIRLTNLDISVLSTWVSIAPGSFIEPRLTNFEPIASANNFTATRHLNSSGDTIINNYDDKRYDGHGLLIASYGPADGASKYTYIKP